MSKLINWRKPSGGDESIIVVGSDLNTGLAGPWNIVAGRLEGLRLPDSVMIDRVFMDKLGVKDIGTMVEINGNRARVVGLTDGIRSFTTAPWVFASFRNAQHLAGLGEELSNYVIGTRSRVPTRSRSAMPWPVPYRGPTSTQRRSSPPAPATTGCSPPGPGPRCCYPPCWACWWGW